MSIYFDDCLNVLPNIADNTVDLVYLDPPFYTQKNQSLKTRDNSKEYTFKDTWNSMEEYLEYINIRLIQCKRVLKDTGSIFLHCDRSASHYLRILLDNLFGSNNFQSEIIWYYKRWSNSKKGLLNCHQSIFFYSKSGNFKFNTIYSDYSETTNVDQILQLREKDHNGKSVYKKDDQGNVILSQEKKGVPLSDVWEIPYLNPKASERSGYPTQKPILLLERIINLVTDKGDLVLDPFCGSGTTLVSASLLNRKYIGIDISKAAIELTNTRLNNPIKTNSNLLIKGKSEYINKTDNELSILESLDAIPVQRNKGIDGFLKTSYLGGLVSIRIQKEKELINEALSLLLKSSKSKKCSLMVLIRTNPLEQVNMFNIPDNVLLIDRYDIILQKWLNKQNIEIRNIV